MKNKLILIVVLFLFLISESYAQHHYEQPVEQVTEQWHRVELPIELFGRIGSSYASLRVYGQDEKGAAIEQPYLLQKETPRTILREVPTDIINQTRQGNDYFFTFKITDTLLLGQVNLDIKNEEFDWKIMLEGSTDQKEWFTMLDDYRIIAIPDAYRFTQLNFSPVNYPFLRLKIKATKKPLLASAKIYTVATSKGEYQEWTPKSITQIKPKPESKTSHLLIDLGRPLPVSYLNIMPVADYDYYRGFTTWFLTDSTKTDKGWRENWRRVASGTLSSFDKNIFTYPEKITTKIKLEINNQDNQPLTIPTVQVKSAKHHLLVRFDNKAPYTLHYGNHTLRHPSYDLVKFKNKLPKAPTLVTLGKTTLVPDMRKEEGKALFENSLWLYLLMGIIIIVLGTFTLKMMRSEPKE